jgi:hypothetical protein
MDIDIVVAYGYPSIAAMDTLLHLHHYISDDVSEKDLDQLSASLIVTRLGAMVGILLLLSCIAMTKERLAVFRESAFCILGSLFLTVAVKTFDFVYKYHTLDFSSFMAIVLPILFLGNSQDSIHENIQNIQLRALIKSNWDPWHCWVLGISLSTKNSRCIYAMVDGLCLNSVLMISLGLAMAIEDGKVRIQSRLAIALYFLLIVGFLQPICHALVDLSIMTVSFCLHPSLAVPPTLAALSDLDQMAALVLSGVLVLLGSIWDVYGSTLWEESLLVPDWFPRYARLPKSYVRLELSEEEAKKRSARITEALRYSGFL